MEDKLPENNLLRAVNGLALGNKSTKAFADPSDHGNKVDYNNRPKIEPTSKEIKKIPRFPIEVFPLQVQEIIKKTNESLNFPIDFFGASILFSASIAIGNTCRIEVKKGWEENAALFIANVGKPNTNKSHPLSYALEPIFEKDRNAYLEYKTKKYQYEQAIKSRKGSEKESMSENSMPVWEKSILTDFTPEALSEVHTRNRRGIGVYVDELAGWFKNFNRYRKGADQEFWLSAWSHKPISIDRKNTDPIYIPLPFISVCGNIPTWILNELGSENRSQNGFIDRMLFAFPDGLEKPYLADSEINSEIMKGWKEIISRLQAVQLHTDGNLTPTAKILNFSPEAFQMFKIWHKANTDLCNNTENEFLASIYGKFDIHVARIALILEMLQFACGESDKAQVGIKAVSGALKLAEYFQATALKVHSIIWNENPLGKLSARYRKLYDALPDPFQTSEGYKVANAHEIPPDTFNKWLRRERNILFSKIKTGEYGKLV